MFASCNCCEEEEHRCPAVGWMSLHRWKGSAVIPNDFKDIPGPDGGKSVWERAGLERYEDAVWQWRVVVLGTGDIPDLTELCLAQNRRDWSEWVAPISDRPHSQFFKLMLTDLKYSDSTLTASLVSGTFTLTMIVGSLSESATFNWNDTAATIQAALQALPNAVNAGNIVVTGGPLATDHISVAFEHPIDDVNLTLTHNLTGTPPNVLMETLTDGDGASLNELQLAHYEWPAHAGSFQLSATVGGVTQTTAAIPYNSDATGIRNALLALPILSTPPTVSNSVVYPGTGSGNAIQLLKVNNEATITGGSLQLIATLNGTSQITSPIPWNANAAAVRTALLALPNVLPTDDFEVQGNWVVGCRVEFKGTLGFQFIPAMVVANALTGGDVRVTSSTTPGAYQPANHARHEITFVGALQFANVALMSAGSSLINHPQIQLTAPFASDVFTFRNTFEPLNVGTVWKHYFRKAWGNVVNRTIRRSFKTSTVNEFEPPVPGSLDIQELPCGYGIWQPLNCHLEFRPHQTEAGVQQTGDDFPTAVAEFNEANGTLVVTAELPWEFSLEIRCLGCHYSPEFNLHGIHESSTNKGWQIYDLKEPQTFEPLSSGPCGVDAGFHGPGLGNNPDQQVCRSWRYRPSNVPYLFRQRSGPDGYDVHLIRDLFFAAGTSATRKPPCSPGVVYLGGGYYLEQNYSRGYLEWFCNELAGAIQGHSMERSCPPRPYHENEVEHPTTDVERLKLIYGQNFSWWGNWIDPESITLPQIRCQFHKFNLEGVRVLFLGGFPIGKVPQENNRAGFDGRPGWSGTVLFPEPGDVFFGGAVGWKASIEKDFEPGTLEPLKRWLNDGGGILVFDGGAFPAKLFEELGLSSTIERQAIYSQPDTPPSPDTLNGSLLAFNPKWGPQLPNWYIENATVPYFQECWVEPTGQYVGSLFVGHPFVNGVASGLKDSGEPNIISDFTISGVNIAGQPMGTGHVNRGLINVSQKYDYDDHIYNGFLMSAGTRSYTTCIPKVTPGPNVIVLGEVKGKLPIQGPEALHPSIIGFVNINYPAIVVEHWQATFRLRFVFGGTTAETGPLPFTATATDIKNALEALPNIGSSITVLGSALPSSIDIYFDSPLVQGQNVPELVVLDTDAVELTTIREGSTGVNEIQRVRVGRAPSRIVLSNVNELINQDGWGKNWEGLGSIPSSGSRWSQEEDDRMYLLSGGVIGPCGKEEITYYGKRGYNFGLGLSHIAARKFLENLWEHRDDY